MPKTTTTKLRKVAKVVVSGEPRPVKYHIDRRAALLAAVLTGSDDDMLTTVQTAAWLGVSVPWLEVQRISSDGGPPFERLSPRLIRYNRGKVRRWLDQRSHVSAREYA